MSCCNDCDAFEKISEKQNGYTSQLSGNVFYVISYLICRWEMGLFLQLDITLKENLILKRVYVFLPIGMLVLTMFIGLIDWSYVWGWALERLLHINGHCLHLHMEKSKCSNGVTQLSHF